MNLRKGLVGHWTFDDRDTSGGTLYDRSAYDAHGTINGPTTGVSGIIGEAYDFEDSNGDGIDLGTHSHFEFRTGDFSVSTVVTFESTGSYRTLLEIDSYDNALLWRPDGDQLEVYINGTPWKPTVGFTAGETYHLVIRRSGGTVELFKNGVSQGTNSMTGDITVNNTTKIGRSVHTTGENFDGKIHDMRIWDRSISNDEIHLLNQMRSLQTQSDSLSKGLVGHWTLNNKDVSGGTVYDRTGQSNHAETRNSVTTGVSSPVGEGFSFDGTGDYLPTRFYQNSSSIKQLSVAAWIKSSDTSSQIIYSYDRSEYFRFEMNGNGGTGLNFSVNNSDHGTGDNWFLDGSWHHVAAVFNSSVTNDIKMYIDGSEVYSADVYATDKTIGSGVTRYGFIGTGSEAKSFDGSKGPKSWFNGDMSDVRLYRRPLSASEVNRLSQMRQQ